MRPTRWATLTSLGACAAAIGACGANDKAAGQIPGHVLRIYSSVPLQGPSGMDAQAIVNGARLALAQVHGRIGKYQIVLSSLDDSTSQRGTWDPGQTTANARQAVMDTAAVGYLGEFNSGASAISIPILNRAGIAQISPASTAVGLTSDTGGSSPGEPQKYYPTGVRTFARVLPNDAVQAAAQVKLQLSVGCRKTYVLDDGEVDGQDTSTSFDLAAQSSRLQVVDRQAFDPRSGDFRALAEAVAQSGADCVLISAIAESNPVLLTRQIAAAAPTVKFFAAAGVSQRAYTDPTQGGLPRSLDPRVWLTAATPDRSDLPATGQAFLSQYARRYGSPSPYAIYGYEAMSLMLDAIARATEHGRRSVQRSKVVHAIFATHERSSVLGRYSIDHNGDTSLSRYGIYKVLAGALRFWKAVEA